MIQQINLYDERFKEKKVQLSAIQSLLIFVIAILGIGGFSYYQIQQVGDLNQLTQTNTRKAQNLSNQVASTKAKIDKILADNGLSAQISDAKKEIKTSKKVLNFVQNNQFGSGLGFSMYLSALSNLDHKDIWLDDISIKNDFLRLKGSSIVESSIPAYFQNFTRVDLFKGMGFDHFEINRSTEHDWKIDFIIATKTQKEGAK